jgi:chemotaxis protein MotB
MIVIKKITIAAPAGHGGSWKVAFADFMTAMMAFFLVMWLISQNAEVKKNVADYFSTPSIIEYNFSNYGVELTLEKLFLDLVNEPLKFFQQFVTPVDWTPNLMAMGSKNIVIHHIAEELGDIATGVEVSSDQVVFEIPEQFLFKPGTADFASDYVRIMEKVKRLTAGLEQSNVFVDSVLFGSAMPKQGMAFVKDLAEKRMDLVTAKIQVGLENETVDVFGRTDVSASPPRGESDAGKIRVRIKQKDLPKDGATGRRLETMFGEPATDLNVYDNFVKQLTNQRAQGRKTEGERRRERLENIDKEFAAKAAADVATPSEATTDDVDGDESESFNQ